MGETKRDRGGVYEARSDGDSTDRCAGLERGSETLSRRKFIFGCVGVLGFMWV